MSRLRRRTDGGLDEFDTFSETDTDIHPIPEAAGSPRRARGASGEPPAKAAWQRLDERRELKALKEELADWEDWDVNLPDGDPGEGVDASTSY